ncbi:MAG: type pilus assembly PilZ [Holophagaceae bacterium]|nr:type pilus assembly PilZ [Holophagaceae bacterium]
MNAVPDQRTHERIPFSQKVKVISMGRIAAYTVAINIGMGGVLLRSATNLPVGTQCRVAIPVPDGDGTHPLLAEGLVVRSDEGGTAVKFLSLIEQTSFHSLASHAEGTLLRSILGSYQAYFQVSRNQDLADCEKLLGVTKRQFRTTFYITFFSCISLAILSVWLYRPSMPAAPNWLKIVLSFAYGTVWLGAIQPTLDLTVFRFLRLRRARSHA